MELRFVPVTGENRSAVLRLRTRPGREGCICDGELQGSFLTQFGTEMSTSILWKMYRMCYDE